MKLFIDTANVEEIKQANDMGIICGVTTNPSLMVKDGMTLISDIAEIFNIHGIKSQIIAASVRHPIHVAEDTKAGCNIATVPFKVLEQMTKHPLTDSGIFKFKEIKSKYIVKLT